MAGAKAVHVAAGSPARRGRAGAKPSQRRSGFSQISRRADRCSRSISRRSRSGSSRSRPSVISSTTAPWPSTRRDQSRLKAWRQAPIRVPPSQSSRLAACGGQRGVDVALAQVAGDVGQPRPEGEGVDLGPAGALGVGGGMQEMQQHPAVGRHRARDVAERDQVRPAHPARPQSPAAARRLPSAAPRASCRASRRRARAGRPGALRLAIGRTGSSSRAIARRASATVRRSTSARSRCCAASLSAEKVSVASISISSPPSSRGGGGASAPSSSASAARRSAAVGFGAFVHARAPSGASRLIMCSMNFGSRQ